MLDSCFQGIRGCVDDATAIHRDVGAIICSDVDH